MRFALYGDEEVVDHRFAKVKQAFEQIPGAEVWGKKCAPDEVAKLEHPAELIQAGVPNLAWNTMTGWYGGEEGGHIGFSPVAPLTARDALPLRDLLRGLVEQKAGLDYIVGNLAINARSFIHVTMVIFDTKNEAQVRRAYDTSKLLVSEAAKAGVRRVPRAPGLHGPRRRPVQLQRPRLPPLHRDDQGRTRPERDPLARETGDLAQIDARQLQARDARPDDLSARTTPPFRADHVGSLLRPPKLLQARDEAGAGRISAAALRAVEDEAIHDAVRMQEDVGLQSATDGEFRRGSWHMDFIYQIGGVTRLPEEKLKVAFHSDQGDVEAVFSGMHVDGKVHLEHTIFDRDFGYLAQMVTTATPKLTIPSPSMIHYRGGRAAIDSAVYPDLGVLEPTSQRRTGRRCAGWASSAARYLQLDDTSLSYLNDPSERQSVASRGGDAEPSISSTSATSTRRSRSRPAEMTVTTHTCRGNFRSSWVAEGGYDFVAEALFNELEVDGFFLEFDDKRSGTFEPLRHVPKGKLVILGLVTTKRGELEAKDELKRRIEEATQYIDLDQLCLSPQCGFSSTVDGNALSYDQEVAKLRLVVETATEVWG